MCRKKNIKKNLLTCLIDVIYNYLEFEIKYFFLRAHIFLTKCLEFEVNGLIFLFRYLEFEVNEETKKIWQNLSS
ncbi:hypothetical protein CHH51_04105 [Terribacillus saccharophilus]|nr:hypothetical protein CHH51_04105 [Terribacillus saccharophilus]